MLQGSEPATPVEVVLPVEGSTGWSDTWMLASRVRAPQLRLHVHEPHHLARGERQATEYFGEAPANAKACALTSTPNHCDTYHATDEEYFSNVWYWSTPQAQCLDGRTDVVCKDYSEWTQAWTEIKG